MAVTLCIDPHKVHQTRRVEALRIDAAKGSQCNDYSTWCRVLASPRSLVRATEVVALVFWVCVVGSLPTNLIGIVATPTMLAQTNDRAQRNRVTTLDCWAHFHKLGKEFYTCHRIAKCKYCILGLPHAAED